jgi:crotonobetaine/carnitine-CoA ligase
LAFVNQLSTATPPAPHAASSRAPGRETRPAPASSSLPALLRHWARSTPEAPFLCFQDLDGSCRRWTYGEFQGAVDELAGGLAAAGLRAGERCVLHTGNSVGFMPAFWAVLELGAIAVPTIAQYSVDELRFVLEDSGARLAVVSPDLLEVAAAASSGLDCDLVLEGQLGSGGPRPLPSDRAAEPTALVIYTSGTTSRPKGVMLGHEGLVFTARCYAEHFRLQRRDTTLVCLPLFHVNALVLQMLPVLHSGGQMVLAPRFSASRYWGWVHDHGVTAAHLVAGPVRLLLDALAEPRDAGHQLRLVSFGMPLDDREIAEFERRFEVPLLMIWGSTETGCGGTLMPLDQDRRPGHQRIGPAMRGWDVVVAEPGTEPARRQPDGEAGELLVSSPGTMLGYFGQPEATAQALRGGWVHTGDLGWRDADGYFHFVDRLKDMIKPAGENVAAGEVERVVLSHPGVLKCAVVGLADPVRMESVVAVVVRVDGSDADAAEIQAWCRGRLAAFKVPSRVEFRASLPETSIGKVRKAELKRSLGEKAPR